MSLFIDTGVFVAIQNERDEHHEAAREAMTGAFQGSFGALYTSDYVYDEVVTLVRARTNDHDEARLAGDRIIGNGTFADRIELLFVGEERFERSVRAFNHYDDQSLSFTDASTVALVESGIDRVLSFDGIVDRVDPASL